MTHNTRFQDAEEERQEQAWQAARSKNRVQQAPSVTTKNYLTPEGFQALQKTLLQLIDEERPKTVQIVSWAASNGDRSENGDYIYGKKKLREIDKRIHQLTKKMESAIVVNPKDQVGSERVFFGAWVTYLDGQGAEHTVRIVGVDEADPASHAISWISPLATCLLKKQLGDVVIFHAPQGMEELEIIGVSYTPPT